MTLDCFCVDCGKESVFYGPDKTEEFPQTDFKADNDRTFTRQFLCTRVLRHEIYFNFRIKNGVLTKIGQSPSMADLSELELHEYRKVLTEDDYRELSRAVGLAAHGVGIGSFVYLRRVFERLIGEARERAAKLPAWDESAFQKERMDEKIERLRDQLPAFLVEHRSLYSILSKGIHSLGETECLEAFSDVRLAIELILDEKVAAKQREQKEASAKSRLTKLQQKLASSGTAQAAAAPVTTGAFPKPKQVSNTPPPNPS